MKKKSLAETNPYLQDPTQRRKLIARSVRTSCGVEGIKLTSSSFKITKRRAKRIYKKAQ
jgi:hypothetical protein